MNGGIGDRIAFALFNDDQCLNISRSHRDVQWHVEAMGQKLLPSSTEVLLGMPPTIDSVDTLRSVLQHVQECAQCEGNREEKFEPVTAKGNFLVKFHSYVIILRVSLQAYQLARNARHL